MNKLINFWIMRVSRGYSLPMSLTNWLVVFSFAFLQGGNVLYGIIALIGFMFAHMGTNVFDDVVDQWLKVPKQKYKSTYLDTGETNLRTIFILAICYFIIAFLFGIFFFVRCGYTVLIIAVIGALIALLYPKLNNYALGEVAVGLTFGPLFFAGVYFVMMGKISLDIILVSIPVAIFTVVVLMVHALMDYDFDLKSGKKTLVILVGSKQAGLNLILSLLLLVPIITLILVLMKILPIFTLSTLLIIPAFVPLYKKLDFYNKNELHKDDEFINNFAFTRNIGTAYCLLLMISLFF